MGNSQDIFARPSGPEGRHYTWLLHRHRSLLVRPATGSVPIPQAAEIDWGQAGGAAYDRTHVAL